MSKSLEDQIERMYGDKFAAIDKSRLEEIKEGIKSGDKTYTEGVVRETRRDGEQYPSQWTVEVVGPRQRSVHRIHEERSERAQDTDERQNAPVTTDENKWIENPDRYDYPGVDTIPESRLAARAEAVGAVALERGWADRVEHKGRGTRLQGKFSPKGSKTYGRDEAVVRVVNKAEEPAKTLAHELGHALDYDLHPGRGRYGLSDKLFGDLELGLSDDPTPEERREVAKRKGQLKREAEEISKKARGGYTARSKYRNEDAELTADFVGQAILQPRATRRDAPNLFQRLEEVAAEEGFSDIFPHPLERDPERQGILQD